MFAQGGFDVVIGNPPYVRMELIKPIKPYLEKHYVVADDRTDLYAYFFERGVGLLKDGGRLGYISSSTFFRTGSGEKLRTFLGDDVAIETVVDFGDAAAFRGRHHLSGHRHALRKGTPTTAASCRSSRSRTICPNDLGRAFTERARRMPRARLGAAPGSSRTMRWRRLRDKIVNGRRRSAKSMARRSMESRPG